MPDTLSIVDSKPLPDLRVVSSQPLPQDQPGLVSRVVSGVSDTLKKTANNLDVTPALARIGEADSLAGQGRWSEAWDTIRGLLPGGSSSQQVLGNQNGTTFQEQKDFAKDTYDKARAGDYSGATANVATAVLANAGNAPDSVRNAAADLAGKAKDAAGNAADATVTAAKGAAQGVVDANKRGLQNPAHAAALASSVIPVVGYQVAGVIEGGNTLYGAVKGARAAWAERSAANASDAAVAAQRANPQPSLADQAGIQPTNPETPQGPNLTPEELAQIRADQQQKIAARKAENEARVAAQKPNGSVTDAPAEDPALLDDLARSQAKKPFAKLTPAEQAAIRTLAQRLRPSAAPAAPPTPETSTAPANSPSPADAAPRPAPETPVSPSSAALPAAYTETSAHDTASEATPASANGTPGTSLRELVQKQEYYPPETPKHIPTPAELGYGVYGAIKATDSSAMNHIRAENEKAFNAADFAFQNGITNPAVLDRMSEADKRAFMNGAQQEDGTFAGGALQHGREAGNPTPKTTYKVNSQTGSILDGHTLRLAKAHLAKMAADAASPESAENGAPSPPEQPAAPSQPQLSGAQIQAAAALAKARLPALTETQSQAASGLIDKAFDEARKRRPKYYPNK